MSTQTEKDWAQQNQDFLSARFSELRLLLEAGESSFSSGVSDALAADMQIAPSLNQISQLFGLSYFEEQMLVLLAALELDKSCAHALHEYCRQNNNSPNFSLAMKLLPDAHWSAILPSSPLRYWRLIELENGHSLTDRRLRIDERILHYLTGISMLDQRLHGLLKQQKIVQTESYIQQDKLENAFALWQSESAGQSAPIIQLTARSYQKAVNVAGQFCLKNHLPFYQIRASDIPVDNMERFALAKLWQREQIIDGSVLMIRTDGVLNEAQKGFIAMLKVPLLIYSDQALSLSDEHGLRIDLPETSWREQKALWVSALGETAQYINGGLDRVVSQFRIPTETITSIGQQLNNGSASDKNNLEKDLWNACRIQSRKTLNNLAQRIQSNVTLDDLILPEQQLQSLRDIIIQAQQRFTVYEKWGFAEKLLSGTGISALFHGPSGTGKTMAASVIANALELDLYRIDLSQVVNKYIGETEKNLARVFDAAEDCGAVLLFDEADTLFAKRTEVKSSHDRNANMETGYLLQRIEDYTGIAILTTNLKAEIDEAFMRRIRFIVQFPFPDKFAREQIWENIFPESTPTNNLVAGQLAELSMTGGSIRNIALNAAFYAANEDAPVEMRHLARAAEREMVKLEKSSGANVLRSWF